MIEYAVEQDFNDNLVSFFDEDTEIFHMEFKGSGGDTAFNVPILNFKKYPNEFSNLQTYMNSANDSYHFVGIELWQLGQVQLSITESKRNSLSKNQAKSPFNICRHNPIYIFPAKITVKKFL